MITQITPRAVNNIGWKTFIMFGVFCLAAGTFVLIFAKETKGRSLEDMDVLFGAVDADARRNDVEHALHKGSVSHMEEGATTDAEKANERA